jgi:hypothetical protein
MRDPFHDPLPGDIFITSTHNRFEILERFVAVNKAGKESPGLKILRSSANKPEIPAIVAEMPVAVFCVKVRGAQLEKKAPDNDTGWKSVPRVYLT